MRQKEGTIVQDQHFITVYALYLSSMPLHLARLVYVPLFPKTVRTTQKPIYPSLKGP